MKIQIILILVMLVAIVGLGFLMSRSISSYEKNKQTSKKKKGRLKYMPEVKNGKLK